METAQISVKDVRVKTFREFKSEAVRQGKNLGEALTLAMTLWLEKSPKKPRMRFMDFKARSWGSGTERTSEEIDSLVY